jgi:hypothetical protein
MVTRETKPMTCRYTEPPIGIEPMTYALREAREYAAKPLPAPMTPVIAWMTLAALGLSANPVHEPVHVWLANAWRTRFSTSSPDIEDPSPEG